MKKKYIITAALSLAVLTGCSDFLEQDNKGNIGQKDYYSTPVGFNSLSNASYSILRTLYGKDPWLTAGGTDLFATGRTGVNNIALYAITTADADVLEYYTNYYKAISLANEVIYWGGSDSNKAQLVAEARGMRAMYYLELVQQFGGVPLIKERQATSLKEAARASLADTYAFIIEELTDLLDSQLLDKATGVNIGHFDKRAAAHFLAKAYLCRGYESIAQADDFKKAKSYADQAIGGDKLTTAFATLFSVAGEKDNEIIFSVQYHSSTVENPVTNGNKQQAHFCAYLDGQEKGHKYTSSTLTPTLRMHQLFAENTADPKADERYEATFMTELRASYWDFYENAKKDASPVTYYYCPEWLLPDTAAWRAELPSRKDAIIVEMKATGRNINNKETAYESKMKEDVYGVASFRKFDDTDNKGTFAQTASMRDIILARLGETYLIAAEALIKQNLPGEALPYINEVRGRAKATLATADELDIDYLLNERARELAGEYLRWADLKRTGKLISYATTYNPDLQGKTISDDYKLRPIPAGAIELNPALEGHQNPGY